MKVTFISNCFNHHQKPFSDQMYYLLGDNYKFIQTKPMTLERINMGWKLNQFPPYVLSSYLNVEAYNDCIRVINDSDVIIIGSAPLRYIEGVNINNTIIFYYSERLFKKGFYRSLIPTTRYKLYNNYVKPSKNNNVHLLCASAYTPYDMKRINAFTNKMYNWGYFTEFEEIDLNLLLKKKNNKVVRLVWVGRLIPFKNTKHAIKIAKKLKKDNIQFHLDIVGVGPLERKLKNYVNKNGLKEHISFLGAKTPAQVREIMKESNIFLFTSNFREGWGAVLNEAMNSGCAVIASHAIGSVPYLIEDGVNGLIYINNDLEDLYKKVVFLINNPNKQKDFGINAYHKMMNEWNAEVVANRFIQLVNEIQKKGECNLFKTGVCSKSEILKNNWLK